ncbi:MAG: hypothetical protein US31_C0011G0044 [Berkelbacteria bacterium GW2011_GWA1_36_9]|uniref:Uncharacterized protein n=1 Tax=Berkelbacteria bacterium GW2011_GWA1_36_9 TaxID=1618331 RepID=A0A0G0FJS1_9BACT|nr:MAG: hypothetical protein US31_C0011G0044 [Berkelbacteria bacterium GW2011_GWA1_36_9]
MSQRKMPLIVEANENAHFNYRAWRGETIFFRIRFKNGKLSKLIQVEPCFQRSEEISAICRHCGEEVKATVFFF